MNFLRLAPEELRTGLEIKVTYVTEGTEVKVVTGVLLGIESEQVNKAASNSTWRPTKLHVARNIGGIVNIPVPNIVTIYSWDEEASDTEHDESLDCGNCSDVECMDCVCRVQHDKCQRDCPDCCADINELRAQLAADAEFIKQLQQSNQQLAEAVVRVDPNYLELQRKHKKLKRKLRRLQGRR